MNSAPRILLVDRNTRNVNLLCSFLEEHAYRTYGLSTLEAFDMLLASDDLDFDLAFVDLSGFDGSIWERCKRLHDAGITFVAIARRETGERAESLKRRTHGIGAVHTLHKPLRKEQLLSLARILTGTDD